MTTHLFSVLRSVAEVDCPGRNCGGTGIPPHLVSYRNRISDWKVVLWNFQAKYVHLIIL